MSDISLFNMKTKQYTQYLIQLVLILTASYPMTSRSFSLVLVNENIIMSFPRKQEPIKRVTLESGPSFSQVNGPRTHEEDRVIARSHQKKVVFTLK